MKETFILTELEQVQALAAPLRHQILRELQTAQTAKQVAAALKEQPTKLYHHFKLLKEARLISLIEVRQKRGTWEKYYQAVAKKYVIATHLFDYRTGGSQPLKMEKLKAVEQLYTSSQEGIQTTLKKLDEENFQRFLANSIFNKFQIKKTAANLESFRHHLQSLIREAERTDDNASEYFELILGYYPTSAKGNIKERY